MLRVHSLQAALFALASAIHCSSSVSAPVIELVQRLYTQTARNEKLPC